MVRNVSTASTTENDAAYRRGTVLGLTVAEVFILLLFLALIALLALVRDWQVEQNAAQDRLTQMETQLQTWQPVIEKFEAPEEIATLHQQKEDAQQASERHRKRADTLQRMVDKSSAAVVEEALAEAERARAEAHRAQRELHVLRTKGINPPCWYQVVPGNADKSREKPHYAFDVRIADDSMEVLPHPTPPGGAKDDGDAKYTEEAERLQLATLPYGEPLSDAAFEEHFGPIAKAGKGSRVRTYSCIFYVRVWDRTSPSAKARWKSAHDGILEVLFGTYQVKEDPWPGDA